MLADSRRGLIDRIVEHMRSLGEREASLLAREITLAINNSISRSVDSPVRDEVDLLVPAGLRTYAVLDVGWAAYRQVFESALADGTHAFAVRLVCSLPESIANPEIMRDAVRRTGIWPGSLISCIHDILNAAQEQICIVSPYWSPIGVETLLRNLRRNRFDGVDIVVVAQPRPAYRIEVAHAIERFRDQMLYRGAGVSVFSVDGSSDQHPLMHAKIVTQDHERAYVGSANISENGIDNNVEVGVVIEGPPVRSLVEWLFALKSQLVLW